MTDASSRWETISLRDLFARGPWPIVVAGWLLIGAGFGVWAWVAEIRIPIVTQWPLTALAAGFIAWMFSALAAAKFYAFPLRRAWPLFGGFALAGAAVGAACSRAWFQPRPIDTTLCGGTFAIESPAGRAAAFILPLLGLVAWFPWLMLRIPTLRRVERRMAADSSAEDYHYSLAMISFVPIRAICAAIVLAVLFAVAWSRGHFDASASSELQLDALARSPTASAVASARTPSPFARIDGLRRGEEQRALRFLDALQWDEARPAVHAAVCSLATPLARIDPRVRRAEEAFRTLEAEIDAHGGLWRPSADAARAILHLLDVRRDARGTVFPLVPAQQDSSSPAEPTSLRSSSFVLAFHQEPLMEVRVTTARTPAGQPLVMQVALKLAGRAAAETAVFEVLEESLGGESEGRTLIGAGAPCAVWDGNEGRIRLGPEIAPATTDDELNPTSLLWLTWSDARLPSLRPMRSRSGWNAYGCAATAP